MYMYQLDKFSLLTFVCNIIFRFMIVNLIFCLINQASRVSIDRIASDDNRSFGELGLIDRIIRAFKCFSQWRLTG